MLKLELKRLRELLSAKADEVFGLGLGLGLGLRVSFRVRVRVRVSK